MDETKLKLIVWNQIEDSLVLYLLHSGGLSTTGYGGSQIMHKLLIPWLKKDTCRFPYILASQIEVSFLAL